MRFPATLPERSAPGWVATLKRFVGSTTEPVEHCELCNAEIDPRHTHLMDPVSRRLVCACTPCALLFSGSGAGRYLRVPDQIGQLSGFQLSDAQWDALLIPINMAFFFRSSSEGRVLAMYPGPAGATESTLDLRAWDELARANPVLGELQDDVEALLVHRVDGQREYYRVPIDRCYRLVGLIRSHWHGISGGEEVRRIIQGFFQELREASGHA